MPTAAIAPMTRRPAPWLAWTLLGLGSALAPPTLASGPADTPPAPVVVDEVRADVQGVLTQLSAHIEPRQQMTVMAAQAGQLAWILDSGESAAAGAPLARIDDGPLLLDLAERQARLRRSEVQLRRISQQIARFDTLDQRAFVSPTDLDDLQTERELIRADIAIAQAQIAQLEDRRERMVVRAPFAGVVLERRRDAGEQVAIGDVLAEFAGREQMQVRAQLPLSWLQALRPGLPIGVRAAGREATATIRALIPAADSESQTFVLLADLPGGADGWPAGQLVSLVLPQRQAQRSLLVPRDALVLRREGHRVVRIDGAGRAEWVPVTLGAGRGDWIAVEGELAAGERVAIRGAERLQPGQAVQILADRAEGRSPDLSPGAGAG